MYYFQFLLKLKILTKYGMYLEEFAKINIFIEFYYNNDIKIKYEIHFVQINCIMNRSYDYAMNDAKSLNLIVRPQI